MTPRHPSDLTRRHFFARFAAAGMPMLALALMTACNLQLPGSSQLGSDVGRNDNLSAAPAVPGPQTADEGSAAALRAIEEADVLKIQDGRAYVLNQYRGFFIIDVSNPDVPAILGHMELKGRPVEMYVVGARAYVVASSDVYYAYNDVSVLGAPGVGNSEAFAPPAFDGSKVTVVDVSDAAAPKAMGDIKLVGYANASRRVGDVIYVIGNDIPGPFAGAAPLKADDVSSPQSSSIIAPDYYQEHGFVASINVADPNDVKPVERKSFEGSGINLHVSQTALFVTSTDYGYRPGVETFAAPEETTHVLYVDISDAAGAIKLRGTVDVPGVIRNRFYLDDFEGVLRVATESWGFGFQKVRLFTYDLANPDDIKPLGRVQVIQGESLEAVRFDGPRGYLVTFLRRDPLFVMDLRDPTKPAATGRLEVPGFSTHIDPRGDRLIAVGVDDTQGNRPAVALYDVSDVTAPKQVSRIVVGPKGQYVGSNAIYDEKAYKIVDELGLIAIPFNYYKEVDGSSTPRAGSALAILPYYPSQACVAAVQLIDFSTDGLTQRGVFEHRGNVERVGAIGSRVYGMSQLGFQTVNIDDRDNPASLAFVPFVDETEMAYYDGCGGYYSPNPIPVDFFPFPMFSESDVRALLAALDAYLNAGGTCGTISAPPLAGLLGFVGFVGLRRRRRMR